MFKTLTDLIDKIFGSVNAFFSKNLKTTETKLVEKIPQEISPYNPNSVDSFRVLLNEKTMTVARKPIALAPNESIKNEFLFDRSKTI